MQFGSSQIQDILARKGIDLEALKPFIMDAGFGGRTTCEITANPLLARPVVKVNDEYILVLPGSVTAALRHFIWSLAVSLGVRNHLGEYYDEVLEKLALRYFGLLGYEREDIGLPEAKGDLPFHEHVFRFDLDKVKYTRQRSNMVHGI